MQPTSDPDVPPRPSGLDRLIAIARAADPTYQPPWLTRDVGEPCTATPLTAPEPPTDASAPSTCAATPQPTLYDLPLTTPDPLSGIPAPSASQSGVAAAAAATDGLRGLWRYAFVPDPRKFVMRVCRFVLCTRGPRNHEFALGVLRGMNLPALFPAHGLTPERVEELCDELWRRAEKQTRVRDRDTMPLFLVTPQVAERVPAGDLVTRRQNLGYEELAFVLRTITLKVVDAMADGEDGLGLARRYFLSPGYRDAFRRRTGRRLNADKLAAVTGLLVRHGFLARENWQTRGRGSSRFDTTRYRLGPRRLLLPSVFIRKAGLG